MRFPISLVVVAAVAFPALAQAPKVANDLPLIVDGPIAVDAGDVNAYLLQFPEDKRANLFTSRERVATVADGVFVARSFAAKARAAGMDQDPIIQRRLKQVQDNVLAELYIQRLEKGVNVSTLDQRVRELYNADAAKYRTPPLVSVDHILVDFKGRTREMAREPAADIHQRVTTGKEDFLTLAGRYSDDPSKNRNGGSLGFSSPESFIAPVRDAIAKLKSKGEISEPIEADDGIHLVRLVDRKASEPVPFEAVRKKLMEAEAEKLRKQKIDAAVQEIRSTKTVVIHNDNVDSMILAIDPEIINRAREQYDAAAKKAPNAATPDKAAAPK